MTSLLLWVIGERCAAESAARGADLSQASRGASLAAFGARPAGDD